MTKRLGHLIEVAESARHAQIAGTEDRRTVIRDFVKPLAVLDVVPPAVNEVGYDQTTNTDAEYIKVIDLVLLQHRRDRL